MRSVRRRDDAVDQEGRRAVGEEPAAWRVFRQLPVPQDYAQAVQWDRKAAEQGLAEAEVYLGLMYENGTGIPQDYSQAVQWYRKAAEQGLAAAQNNLGLMYYDGRGVTRDYIEAHKWLNLAAARASGENQKDSTGARDALAKKMTRAQVAEAQKRAREWLEAFQARKK